MATKPPMLVLLQDRDVLEDVFEWDSDSWSRAAQFWAQSGAPINGSQVLELGARHGGLSLLFAMAGAEVVCSDLGGPSPEAVALHARYQASASISYRDVDAAQIPFADASFDVVVFKSMLGAVGRNGNLPAARQAVAEMHRVLRPGGCVLFAENLAASRLHRILRRRFVKWGSSWNYMTQPVLEDIFNSFESLELKNWGFFACWGRSPVQRRLLFHLDCATAGAVPRAARYICFGVARKSGQQGT